MPPIPWTAPALARVGEQPATYAGLTTAVRIAAQAAGLVAGSFDGPPRPPALTVREACAEARATLESAWSRGAAPTRPLGIPALPADPGSLRALHPLLLACIDLATELLDNEDEPLGIGQITAIGQAVAHLDSARRACWEVAG